MNGIIALFKKTKSEVSSDNLSSKMNIIRAGVMGANDGIMSTAGIIMGVSGAKQSTATLLLAGISAMFAGAISMGGGEYVSVSTQRDMQCSVCEKQTELFRKHSPICQKFLQDSFEKKGMSEETATQYTDEIINSGNLDSYLKEVFGIDHKNLMNPWHAAGADFISFILGALLPLACVLLFNDATRNFGTMASVVFALFGTGYISSYLGNSTPIRGAIRNVAVGLFTMIVTFYIGTLFG